MADLKVDDLTKFAKDALYVTVGLGVIAFQKAQVQRHELTKQFRSQIERPKTQLDGLSTFFEDRVKVVEERLDDVENRVEALLENVEDRLPEQAREVAQQLRKAAKDARGQLRELVGRSNGSPAGS